jgi:hypothetical protein
MPICAELHKGPKTIQGVRCHTRKRINSHLQLQVVGMEYYIRLPLFPHIALILECGELHSKLLEQINVREGCTFHHLPSSEHDQDQQLAKMELIALILSFETIQF